MKFRNLLLTGAVASLFLMCDPSGDSYIVGDVFTDNQAVLGYVDSFSLKLSTIRLDSFPTSGHKDFFFGCYHDSAVGNVRTESYIPIVHLDKQNIPEDAIYDSLVICFKPKGGWVGDTLQPKTLNVYEVLDVIEPDYHAEQQKMFNHHKLRRSSSPLATINVRPHPHTKLVSWARMSDSLGRIWFEKLRTNDDVMDNTEDFLNYFKGICVVPDMTDFTWGLDFVSSASKGAASRLIEDAEQFEIRLHYRTPDDDEDDSYLSFVRSYTSGSSHGDFFYNYLYNDRTGTPFENLQIDGDRVYSSQTNNVSYIQTGSGLAIRIDFPTLSELNVVSDYMRVVDARLIIKPKENSFNDEYQLPSKLYLAVTDESNDLFSTLTDLTGNPVASDLYYLDDEHEQPFYSFAMLNFVRNRVLMPSEDFSALIVLPSDAEYATSFKRLVVDDNKNFGENIQLQVYYVTY